jgi:hypothetical protein
LSVQRLLQGVARPTADGRTQSQRPNPAGLRISHRGELSTTGRQPYAKPTADEPTPYCAQIGDVNNHYADIIDTNGVARQ